MKKTNQVKLKPPGGLLKIMGEPSKSGESTIDIKDSGEKKTDQESCLVKTPEEKPCNENTKPVQKENEPIASVQLKRSENEGKLCNNPKEWQQIPEPLEQSQKLQETIDKQNLDKEPKGEFGTRDDTDSEVKYFSSRYNKLGTFEALFLEDKMSFAKIAKSFGHKRVAEHEVEHKLKEIQARFGVDSLSSIKFVIQGESEFPEQLAEDGVKDKLQLFYYDGLVDLLKSKCIAIVGSRKASEKGRKLATEITKGLVEAGFTIVSGLAEGIDVTAHEAAIKKGGKTIGVLGTPIYFRNRYRKKLMDYMAEKQLLISQIPVLYYSKSGFGRRKGFFLERNATISALSIGTVVIEAEDISGSLSTARHASKQGKQIYIPSYCFKDNRIKWPKDFIQNHRAIKVDGVEDILRNISNPNRDINLS